MKHSRSNHWYAALAVLMLLSLALAACGAPAATPAPPAQPTQAPAAAVEPTKAPEAQPTAAPAAEQPTAAPAAEQAKPATAANAEEGEKLVRTLDPKALPAGWKLPETVGHVTNYLVHEWYQNETKGEASAREGLRDRLLDQRCEPGPAEVAGCG